MVIPNLFASNAAFANACGLLPILAIAVADAPATSFNTSFKLTEEEFDIFNPSTIPPMLSPTVSKLCPDNVEILNNP